MKEKVEVSEADPDLLANALDPRDHTFGGIFRRGKDFALRQLASLLVEDQHVRESPSYIYRYVVRHLAPISRGLRLSSAWLRA